MPDVPATPPPPPLVPSGALPAGDEQAEAHNINGAEADATARTQRTSVFIKAPFLVFWPQLAKVSMPARGPEATSGDFQ